MCNKLRWWHLQIRARDIVKQLLPYLKGRKKIVDIGCGSGWISYYLKRRGFDVTLCDVNYCNQTQLGMFLYKDKLTNMDDKEFDAALVISVLHHSEKPKRVIEEAKRVAKKVIILEDTYSNFIEKLLLIFGEWIGEFHLGMSRHYNFYYKFYSINQLRSMLNKIEDKTTWNVLHIYKRGLFILE